jgi:hypothetical protein
VVRVLWRVCLLQALALLGAAVYVVVRAFGRGIHDPALLLVVALFALLGAVLLALGERAVEAGRSWPLTPLTLAETLAVLVSVDLLYAGVAGYAAVVGLPALLVLGALMGPVVRRGRQQR